MGADVLLTVVRSPKVGALPTAPLTVGVLEYVVTGALAEWIDGQLEQAGAAV